MLWTVSQLGVRCLGGGGVAVGGRRRLGLGRLGGLSVYAGFLLGLRQGIEGYHRKEGVPLVLLIPRIGLLCLQTQHGKRKGAQMCALVKLHRFVHWMCVF